MHAPEGRSTLDPTMTKVLTLLGAWLALCCFMCSGSAIQVAWSGQALAAPSSRAVPVDGLQASSAIQLFEFDEQDSRQRAGAERGLLLQAWAHRALSFAEFAWPWGGLVAPKRQRMFGVALARAPPSMGRLTPVL